VSLVECPSPSPPDVSTAGIDLVFSGYECSIVRRQVEVTQPSDAEFSHRVRRETPQIVSSWVGKKIFWVKFGVTERERERESC
jgi:hypothetical protein